MLKIERESDRPSISEFAIVSDEIDCRIMTSVVDTVSHLVGLEIREEVQSFVDVFFDLYGRHCLWSMQIACVPDTLWGLPARSLQYFGADEKDIVLVKQQSLHEEHVEHSCHFWLETRVVIHGEVVDKRMRTNVC